MKTFIIFIIFIIFSSPCYAFFSKAMKSKIIQAKNKIQKELKGGGAMDGGGSGADFPESGAAWFYQDKKSGVISVCIKRSPTFKANYEEIKRIVELSFSKWDNYIQKSDIYREDEDENGKPIPKNPKLRILTKIQIDDTCSEKTEVTFYFGVIDSKVKAVLENMVEPKAFAYRNYKDIDAINGTSKGIVYIFEPKDPSSQDFRLYDWSQSNLLEAVVTHEVGHIVGVSHKENTIMAKDFNTLFSIALYGEGELKQKYQDYLVKIDHENALLYRPKQGETFTGTLGVEGSQDEADTFKFFMGRKIQGKAKIQISSSITYDTFEIEISDSLGAKKFKNLKFVNNIISFTTKNTLIFKRVRKVKNADWGWSQYERDFEIDFSIMGRGYINILKQKILTTISLNFGTNFERDNKSHYVNSPLTLTYIHPQKMEEKILFSENIFTYDLLEKK